MQFSLFSKVRHRYISPTPLGPKMGQMQYTAPWQFSGSQSHRQIQLNLKSKAIIYKQAVVKFTTIHNNIVFVGVTSRYLLKNVILHLFPEYLNEVSTFTAQSTVFTIARE